MSLQGTLPDCAVPTAPRNARWIELLAPDGGRFDAYLSLPAAPKGPGILLLQEVFGVNRHIRGVADQYALDGFVVLAPDVFWRHDPRLQLDYSQAEMERGLALKARLDLAATVRDLAAAVQALRARPECGGRVASLGYCMGGLLSYLCAAQGLVDAAICYYAGGIQGQLQQAPRIACPIQMHFAGRDRFIASQTVDAVRGALEANADATVHVYPDADHGFNCWDRGAYEPRAAVLAHGRSLQFLADSVVR